MLKELGGLHLLRGSGGRDGRPTVGVTCPTFATLSAARWFISGLIDVNCDATEDLVALGSCSSPLGDCESELHTAAAANESGNVVRRTGLAVLTCSTESLSPAACIASRFVFCGSAVLGFLVAVIAG